MIGVLAIITKELGLTVVCIEDSRDKSGDRYYAISAFDPATSTQLSHTLTGKDITNIIDTNITVTWVRKDQSSIPNAIMGRINDLPDQKIQFHSAVKYRIYRSM